MSVRKTQPWSRPSPRLQGQMTSHASSISQYAALAALAGEQPELKGWVAEFEQRRDRICQLFNAIPGLSIATPGGAFYAFVDWPRGKMGRTVGGRLLNDDAAWADYPPGRSLGGGGAGSGLRRAGLPAFLLRPGPLRHRTGPGAHQRGDEPLAPRRRAQRAGAFSVGSFRERNAPETPRLVLRPGPTPCKLT